MNGYGNQEVWTKWTCFILFLGEPQNFSSRKVFQVGKSQRERVKFLILSCQRDSEKGRVFFTKKLWLQNFCKAGLCLRKMKIKGWKKNEVLSLRCRGKTPRSANPFYTKDWRVIYQGWWVGAKKWGSQSVNDEGIVGGKGRGEMRSHKS